MLGFDFTHEATLHFLSVVLLKDKQKISTRKSCAHFLYSNCTTLSDKCYELLVVRGILFPPPPPQHDRS